MEGLGTYSEMIDIADRAAGGYEPHDGCIESYAEWIVEWYKTEGCPEPIKSNKYHQHLLKEYGSTIRSLIIRRLQARA